MTVTSDPGVNSGIGGRVTVREEALPVGSGADTFWMVEKGMALPFWTM
jgi:hypothetical protein